MNQHIKLCLQIRDCIWFYIGIKIFQVIDVILDILFILRHCSLIIRRICKIFLQRLCRFYRNVGIIADKIAPRHHEAVQGTDITVAVRSRHPIYIKQRITILFPYRHQEVGGRTCKSISLLIFFILTHFLCRQCVCPSKRNQCMSFQINLHRTIRVVHNLGIHNRRQFIKRLIPLILQVVCFLHISCLNRTNLLVKFIDGRCKVIYRLNLILNFCIQIPLILNQTGTNRLYTVDQGKCI